MKLILRIGAILAVALVIVGAAVAVNNLSGSSTGGEGGPQAFSEQGVQQVRLQLGGSRPDGDFGGGRDGGGLSSLIGNLLKVGLIVAVVVVVMRGWKLVRATLRRTRLGPTPAG